ncbi:MAG: 4Fe-4S dicluster domain-containing protein [Magnetococcus sp. WYHC-3]
MADPASRPRHRGGMTRRAALRHGVLFSAAVAAAGAATLPVLPGRAHPLLRPPGAVPEKQFLASCIKCGQCVQVCPVNAILLASMDEGHGHGTAWIDARAQACDFSCDALQCILACPTGALDHRLAKPVEVRMGLAVLESPDRCLARAGQPFRGHPRGPDFPGMLRQSEVDRWRPLPVREHPYERELCDLCVLECPIPGAIRMAEHTLADGRKVREPVVLAACTGCGVCEMLCPTQPASIVVVPWKTFESAGEHHGLG